MMRRLFVALILPLSLGVACHKAKPKQVKSAAQTSTVDTTTGNEINTGDSSGELATSENPPAPVVEQETTSDTQEAFDPIYFDFDDASLSQEAMLQLDELGSYLNLHAEAGVIISGHTDERGTEEYNLALSDERARSAKDYLTRLRIDPARITLIPYGEELPSRVGSNEESWSKNRRDEFKLVEKTATR